jgi:hypothetical protein
LYFSAITSRGKTYHSSERNSVFLSCNSMTSNKYVNDQQLGKQRKGTSHLKRRQKLWLHNQDQRNGRKKEIRRWATVLYTLMEVAPQPEALFFNSLLNAHPPLGRAFEYPEFFPSSKSKDPFPCHGDTRFELIAKSLDVLEYKAGDDSLICLRS